MPAEISADSLAALLDSDASFALIDVREAGEYNSSHIPGASLIPPAGAGVPHRRLGSL